LQEEGVGEEEKGSGVGAGVMSKPVERNGSFRIVGWSLVGGCLSAFGVLLIARFFRGGANGHLAVIVYFPAMVVAILLMHAGPWIAGRVHRSWRLAILVGAIQPLIAGLSMTCWLLATSRPPDFLIALAESVFLSLAIAAGVFLVNLLPLSVGWWRRSWKAASVVALLQPFGLLVLAIVLLLTVGFASPR
jgi:hypothetical protein